MIETVGTGRPIDGGGTVDNTTEGKIPVKKGGVFENSAMQETVEDIESVKNIVAPTASIQFADSLILKSNSDAIEILDCARDEKHDIIIDIFDDSGSSAPFQRQKQGIEILDLQLLDDAQSGDFSVIATATDDIHLEKLIVKPKAAGIGIFSIIDSVTGCTLNTRTEIIFSIGQINTEVEVILNNPIILFTGQIIVINYLGPDLTGHNFISDPTWGTQFAPFARTVRQKFITKNLALEEDLFKDISCKITKSADQTLASGAFPVFITWSGEEYDTDNMFDVGVSDTEIEINTAGKYLVVLQASWQSEGTGQRVFILLINGTQVGKTQYTSVSTGDHTFSWMGDLGIGDTLSMIAFQTNDSGDLDLLGSGTYLAVNKIS